MPTVVKLADLRSPSAVAALRDLLTSLRPHVSVGALRTLEQILLAPETLATGDEPLDPALSADWALDPQLCNAIELDPALDGRIQLDPQIEASQKQQDDALTFAPEELIAFFSGFSKARSMTDGPSRSVVEERDFLAAGESSPEETTAAPELADEEASPNEAVIPSLEASAPHTIEEPTEDAMTAKLDPELSQETSDASEPPPAAASWSHGLFDQLPERARRFLAVLSARGTLLMPDVMEQFGLVRAKGVGGLIEPVQRAAAAAGVALPFLADFEPSGYKRYTWTVAPLVAVEEALLEPVPAPPPQPKKPRDKKRQRPKAKWKGKPAAKDARSPKSKAPRPIKPGPAAPARAPSRTGAPAASGDARRGPPVKRGEPPRPAPRRTTPEVFRRQPAQRADRIDTPEYMRRAERPAAPAPAPARAPITTPPAVEANGDEPARKLLRTPEERLPLPRGGVIRRRTMSDVPVVVIRRRKKD